MDRYFTKYPISEPKKVRFAIMKLTGQANQYGTNVETLRHLELNNLKRCGLL